MGVPIGEADGDHPALLKCQNCWTRYETDETMDSACPECNTHRQFEVLQGGDPVDWRGDA